MKLIKQNCQINQILDQMIENCFHEEIICSKKLSKYVSTFVGIASAGFTILFALTTGIIKTLLKTTKNKKKKHDKILMLTKSKLSGIESLVCRALIDMEVSHEEFIRILKEKDRYEKMKENVRNISEELEEEEQKTKNMLLNSVNLRKTSF